MLNKQFFNHINIDHKLLYSHVLGDSNQLMTLMTYLRTRGIVLIHPIGYIECMRYVTIYSITYVIIYI